MTLAHHTSTPLRRERLRAGLSQVALAVRAGCSLSTVSLAERGGVLSADMAAQLASALSISPSDLGGMVAEHSTHPFPTSGPTPIPGAGPGCTNH